MAEVEYGGLKVGGSKLLLIIPLISMLGGGAWAGFELYNEFRILKLLLWNTNHLTLLV